MIRADLDSISGGSKFDAFRRIWRLYSAHARQRAVSSGGDFLEIVQCRLFTNIMRLQPWRRGNMLSHHGEAAQRLKLRDHGLSPDAIRSSCLFILT